MLTIHLLVDENTTENDITQCLDSVSDVFPQWWFSILVGDLGANQDVVRVCHRYGAIIHPIDYLQGMDKCRNELIGLAKTEWHLLLEPWEVLAAGGDTIVERVQNGGSALSFIVIQEDSVSKQVRLWSKSKFVNPVFEKIEVNGEPSSCLILAAKSDTLKRDLVLANRWVERAQTIPDPYYYRACIYLSMGKIINFLRDAETYLFMEQSPDATTSITMIRYYMASVHCYVKKDASKAIQTLAPCLLTRPLMAEFWCLLGDIFYHLMRKYDKAASFYENAIILGSRRLADDVWPMEISKYNEHPRRMLANCLEIVKVSDKIGSVNTKHPTR